MIVWNSVAADEHDVDSVTVVQVVVGHRDDCHHQSVLHHNLCGDCGSDGWLSPGAVKST